jgi:hypothetical protein
VKYVRSIYESKDEISGDLQDILTETRKEASMIIWKKIVELLAHAQSAYPFLKSWEDINMQEYLRNPTVADFELELEYSSEGITSLWKVTVRWSTTGYSMNPVFNFEDWHQDFPYEKNLSAIMQIRPAYFKSLNSMMGYFQKVLKAANKLEEVKFEFDPEKRGQRTARKFGM